jgi:hypothetical protein
MPLSDKEREMREICVSTSWSGSSSGSGDRGAEGGQRQPTAVAHDPRKADERNGQPFRGELMTSDERRSRLRAILARHGEAARAFRQVLADPQATEDARHAATRAALDTVIACHQEARALFSEEEDREP